MMKNKKIVLLSLIIPALTLTGCQQAKASTTVKATAYKKVYRSGTTNTHEIAYFIFYGKNGHKYQVAPQNVEYKYNITTGNFSEAEVTVENGDPEEAVITLPVSQDKGME